MLNIVIFKLIRKLLFILTFYGKAMNVQLTLQLLFCLHGDQYIKLGDTSVLSNQLVTLFIL